MIKPNNPNLLDELYTFDVYKVYLLDSDTGLELYTESVTDTSLQFKEDMKEIRAGVGNKLMTEVPSSKDITIDLTDVRTRLDWIAAKQGTSVETGTVTAWHIPTTYIAVAGTSGGAKITLANAPKEPTKVRFIKLDTVTGVTTDVEGTVSTKEVAFATGVVAGDSIIVTGYQYEAPAQTKIIDFNTEYFSTSKTCIVEGVVFNHNRKPVYKKQYIFPKVTMDGNYEDTTKSERDGQQLKTTLRVGTPAGSSSLGKLIFIPIA